MTNSSKRILFLDLGTTPPVHPIQKSLFLQSFKSNLEKEGVEYQILFGEIVPVYAGPLGWLMAVEFTVDTTDLIETAHEERITKTVSTCIKALRADFQMVARLIGIAPRLSLEAFEAVMQHDDVLLFLANLHTYRL